MAKGIISTDIMKHLKCPVQKEGSFVSRSSYCSWWRQSRPMYIPDAEVRACNLCICFLHDAIRREIFMPLYCSTRSQTKTKLLKQKCTPVWSTEFPHSTDIDIHVLQIQSFLKPWSTVKNSSVKIRYRRLKMWLGRCPLLMTPWQRR